MANNPKPLEVNVHVVWWARFLLWTAAVHVRVVSRLVSTKGVTTAVKR